jgi:hypothetical protein
MPDPPRRFPTPWHADKMPGGYVVRDANGQAKVLTADEARRIAYRHVTAIASHGCRGAVEAGTT